MTAPTPPGAASPDTSAWRRRLLRGGAIAALLGAVALLASVFLRGPTPPQPPPPTPTPTPRPTPTLPTEPAAAGAFTVSVDPVAVDSTDNAELFAQPPAPLAPEQVNAAVAGAARALERYLNTQFVDPATRFVDGALDGLLTEPAAARLTPEVRLGLGAVDAQAYLVDPQPVSADARVLMSPGGPISVTLTYEARAWVIPDDAEPGWLVQRGSMVFVPVGDDWRADVVDVTLEVPDLDPVEVQT